ncbi:MAG: septum formation initiator family protein [Candidatus Neomarinimicrobiota bacterium]
MSRGRKTPRRQPRRATTSDGARPQRLIRGVLTLGAVVLLLIFFFGDHGLYQLYQLRLERKQIQRNIEDLRAERIQLEEQKLRLETDFEYIERLARERYRMAKKNEKVFKVIETGQTDDKK